MLLITGISRTSARTESRVSGPRMTCRPSDGAALPDTARAPGSTGIPPLMNVTTLLRRAPSPMSQAPGTARLMTATMATSSRPAIDMLSASPPRRGAAVLAMTPARRPGQNLRSSFARFRQLPPDARPTTKPARSPLTSMGIASQWLARQPPSELRPRLVVDGRQLAHIEGPSSTILDERCKCANDLRIELDPLVSIQLFHRAFMTNRLAIDTV